MTATLIDGKAVAAAVRTRLAARVAAFVATRGYAPGLAVVLVGENPASQVYVRNKVAQCGEVGVRSIEHRLPAATGQADLLALIAALNRDPAAHGILVQLPLPKHIDEAAVLAAIDPAKDADGFQVVNAGLLATGGACTVPCTPLGCMMLIEATIGDIAGLDAVVVGRSNIVGKPMAQLLLRASCTVTIAHSKTRDLAAVCRRADILVAAVGRPEFLRGDWIKPGACVIDVGINRVPAADGSAKTRLVGDVAFAEAKEIAGAITPVPGGVGPMTIACLLTNTLALAERA